MREDIELICCKNQEEHNKHIASTMCKFPTCGLLVDHDGEHKSVIELIEILTKDEEKLPIANTKHKPNCYPYTGIGKECSCQIDTKCKQCDCDLIAYEKHDTFPGYENQICYDCWRINQPSNTTRQEIKLIIVKWVFDANRPFYDQEYQESMMDEIMKVIDN